METKLEGIAAKARKEPNLRFTSLCHHITRGLVWDSLCNIPKKSSSGIDGIAVEMAKEDFNDWIEEMLRSIHVKGYKAPAVRRVWISKPGKSEKRPIGVPCVANRALQRSASTVLSCIYEQDFLPCSFGGRPNLGAHNALATLNEIISGKKVSWVLKADLKNFFGSLVEFGRFAHRHAKEKGKKLETLYFLGFTHFCTRNRKGNFMVGRKTEKSRFKRSCEKLRKLMRENRHCSLREQTKKINQVLRGHYAYYGVGGNIKSLKKIYRFTERYWRRMLSSRSRKSYVSWERFQFLKSKFPLQLPRLYLPYARLKALAVL